MMQSGVPDFDVAVWLGFAVPAGTPATRRSAPERRDQPHQPGSAGAGEAAGPGFRDAAAEHTRSHAQKIEEDQALWLPLIKQSGATAE